MIKAGPFGSYPVHNVWEEKGKTAICRIYLCYSEDGVHSIQFAYKEGTSFEISQKYGGNGGGTFESVILDYPSEILTGVRGLVNNAIASISFSTNRRTYGPFGSLNPDLKPFAFKFGAGEFFGFHGYTSTRIASSSLGGIGVYLKPCIIQSSQSSAAVKSEESLRA